MLKKLLKYDLEWMYKVLIIFYILAITFSTIGRGLESIENSLILNIVGQVCVGIAISMMINIIINNMIRIWVRFIRNIYKDESYLTHTLPIRKKTIYLSKVLSAIITMFMSVCIIFLCITICYYSKANIEFLKTSLELVASTYDSTIIGLVFVVFAMLFLQMLFALLAGYIGVIIGHKSNNGKMVKSVLYGFIAYTLPQIATLGILFIIGLFNANIMNLFNTTNVLDINTIKFVMYAVMTIYICCIGVYYIFGKKQFEKGVNVD